MDKSLQNENFSLRQQLEALLTQARLNEDRMRRFDRLERRLIGAGSLVELVRLLLSEYKQAFGVEFVTLMLVDQGGEVGRAIVDELGAERESGCLILIASADSLPACCMTSLLPVLDAFDKRCHQALFNAPAGAVASVAILPLVRQELSIGSLHLGSANAERYIAGSGTDFLERLAAIVAVCLETALTQERLKQAGLTDCLTGVQNRRYFDHRAHIEISQARRYKHSLACMFLDIDKFKRINDTYGHPVGDLVLRTVAGLIQAQLRAGDTIARYGGEEFVVLLPQALGQHAYEIAERIRCRIEEAVVVSTAGEDVRVTISIGLALLPADGLPGDNREVTLRLVAAADKALYRAKHTGRNRVVCDGPEPFGAKQSSAQNGNRIAQKVSLAGSHLSFSLANAIGMLKRFTRA